MIDVDDIIDKLNKQYDLDTKPILDAINKSLDDDSFMGEKAFHSIMSFDSMCGQCDSGTKQLQAPTIMTMPDAFSDFGTSDDSDDDSLMAADNAYSRDGAKRSSEQVLKDKAFSASYGKKFLGHQCTKGCTFDCKSLLLADAIENEMIAFWGPKDSPAHPMSMRKTYIIDKLRKSIAKVRKADGSTASVLIFSVGQSEICEATYLRVVGLSAGLTMWDRIKQALFAIRHSSHLNDIELAELEAMISMKKASSETRGSPKTDHAITFIKYFAEFHASDSPNPDEENLRILPFESLSQLFDEYKAHCVSSEQQECFVAKKECFRLAWISMYKQKLVRFTRGKGTFPTCDLCNNCNDMLSLSKSSRKWTRHQRDIIFHFKSMHLKQQAHERKALEDR